MQDRKICGAHARSTGQPCKRRPRPNGRCKLHGGASLISISSPQYITGRYSKYMPKLPAWLYHPANGPTYEELIYELDWADSLLSDLLWKLDTNENGAAWKAAANALSKYRRAQERDRTKDANRYLHELDEAIEQGQADHKLWQAICAMIEERRRQVDTKRKRFRMAQTTLTIEDATTFSQAIAASLTMHVNDQAVLSALLDDLGRIVSNVHGSATQP